MPRLLAWCSVLLRPTATHTVTVPIIKKVSSRLGHLCQPSYEYTPSCDVFQRRPLGAPPFFVMGNCLGAGDKGGRGRKGESSPLSVNTSNKSPTQKNKKNSPSTRPLVSKSRTPTPTKGKGASRTVASSIGSPPAGGSPARPARTKSSTGPVPLSRGAGGVQQRLQSRSATDAAINANPVDINTKSPNIYAVDPNRPARRFTDENLRLRKLRYISQVEGAAAKKAEARQRSEDDRQGRHLEDERRQEEQQMQLSVTPSHDSNNSEAPSSDGEGVGWGSVQSGSGKPHRTNPGQRAFNRKQGGGSSSKGRSHSPQGGAGWSSSGGSGGEEENPEERAAAIHAAAIARQRKRIDDLPVADRAEALRDLEWDEAQREAAILARQAEADASYDLAEAEANAARVRHEARIAPPVGVSMLNLQPIMDDRAQGGGTGFRRPPGGTAASLQAAKQLPPSQTAVKLNFRFKHTSNQRKETGGANFA